MTERRFCDQQDMSSHTATGAPFRRKLCACARSFDAMRGEIFPYRLGALCTERDVVLAGAPLISVTFDREGVAIVAARAIAPVCPELRAPVGLNRFDRSQKNAIADVDHEILRATRYRQTCKTRLVWVVCASG